MKLLPRLVLLGTFAPASYSQSILYNFDGDSTDDSFGGSAAACRRASERVSSSEPHPSHGTPCLSRRDARAG